MLMSVGCTMCVCVLITCVLTATTLTFASACSHVRVKTPEGDVIGRTMELGGSGGELGNLIRVDQEDQIVYNVVVHPAGEDMESHACKSLVHRFRWQSKLAFVSIDMTSERSQITVISDGINADGLSVSMLTLQQSKYEEIDKQKHNICWLDFVGWALGSFSTVRNLTAALSSNTAVVQNVPCADGQKLHWAVDDTEGDHVVVEYLEGKLVLHNNTVGVVTNDPDYSWHLRNLNNYVSVSGTWPTSAIGVQTEVGVVPRVVGHGFNLNGIPGDMSPPSRFVKLFYLYQYAAHANSPADVDDGVVMTTGLLNNVWIVRGTVASELRSSTQELTAYSTLKLPQQRHFYFKSYKNTQWKLVRLESIDLTKMATIPLDDGSLGVKDISSSLNSTR